MLKVLVSTHRLQWKPVEGTCLPYTVQDFHQFCRCKSAQLALAVSGYQGGLQL